MSPTPEDTRRDHDVPDVEQDTVSDPALDDEQGSDWSDEGGATQEGPATETDDA